MLNNKNLLSKYYLNTGHHFLCYEYALRNENIHQVFINEKRFAINKSAKSDCMNFHKSKFQKTPPYLIKINCLIAVDGYILLCKDINGYWQPTTHKFSSERPKETLNRQLLQSFSIVVKKERSSQLLFLGNLKNSAQKVLAERGAENCKSNIECLFEPDIEVSSKSERIDFFIANRYFDSLENCAVHYDDSSGCIEATMKIDVNLPKKVSIVESHCFMGSSEKWVHESEIKSFIKNNFCCAALRNYF